MKRSRALWSLGYKKPPTYTFPFWVAYGTVHAGALLAAMASR